MKSRYRFKLKTHALSILISAVCAQSFLSSCATTEEKLSRSRRAAETAKEKKYPVRKELNGQEQKLILAIQQGNMPVLRSLIEKGIDPNTIFWTGERPENPLVIAIRAGNLRAIRFLLKKGSDPDGLPAYYTTPLISAIEAGRAEATSELLNAGAIASSTTLEDWNSPLIAAAQNGNSRLVDTLVKMGSMIDQADREGRTPLMAAVQYGHPDCVQKLIDLGASVALRNRAGKTAIEIVPSRNKESIKKILKVAMKKTEPHARAQVTAQIDGQKSVTE